MENLNIKSPLKEILRDYCHVEWIDEAALKSDMEKNSRRYSKTLFLNQLKHAIENKTITPEDYFKVTGDELDELEEVVEALQEILDSITE